MELPNLKRKPARRFLSLVLWFIYGLLSSLAVYLLFPNEGIEAYLALLLMPVFFMAIGIMDGQAEKMIGETR